MKNIFLHKGFRWFTVYSGFVSYCLSIKYNQFVGKFPLNLGLQRLCKHLNISEIKALVRKIWFTLFCKPDIFCCQLILFIFVPAQHPTLKRVEEIKNTPFFEVEVGCDGEIWGFLF
jgi:hypothetical protein